MENKIKTVNKKIKDFLDSEELEQIEETNKKHLYYNDIVFKLSMISIFGMCASLVSLGGLYYSIYFCVIPIVELIIIITAVFFQKICKKYPYIYIENRIEKIFYSTIPKNQLDDLAEYIISKNKEKIQNMIKKPIDLEYDFKNQNFTYNKNIVNELYEITKALFCEEIKSETYVEYSIFSEIDKTKILSKLEIIVEELLEIKDNYNLIIPDHNEVFIVDCKNRIKLMVEKDEYLMKEFNNYISYGAKYHQKHNKLDGIVYQDPFEYHNFFIKNNYFEKTKKILEETIRTKNKKSEELINSLAQNIGEDLSKYYQFKEVHKILTYYPVKIHGEEYNNHCWKCHSDISSSLNKQCDVCGWFICNKCHSCSPSHKK